MKSADYFKLLDGKTMLLTSSERLARELKILYAQDKVKNNVTTWEAPLIVSFSQFIEQLWDKCWSEKQKLLPAHMYYMYRATIENSEYGAQLISGHYMAKTAIAAHRLVQHYNIDISDELFEQSLESKAFAGWEQQFSEMVTQHNLLTNDDIVIECAQNLTALRQYLPNKIVAIGFTEHTPIQQSLFDALQDLDIPIDILTTEECDQSTHHLKLEMYESPMAEIYDVAHQIKSILIKYADNPDAAPRIGLITPNLERQRTLITSTLDSVLCPYNLLPGNGDEPRPWRFVSGTPLLNHELISSAHNILGLSLSYNNLADISHFLLSRRYAGNGKEATGRAKVDYQLHKYGTRQVQLETVAKIAEQHAPILFERMNHLIGHLKTHQGKAPPSIWKQRFSERLSLMCWPGGENLSSEYYQAYTAFYEQLDTFANLDTVFGKITSGQALRLFSEMLRTNLFLARQDYYSPLQVMSLDDIEGHEFDVVYAIGLSADVLPRKTDPNPLIPLELQRNLEIPGSHPDIQLRKAENTVHALLSLSDHVHVSYARFSEEGRLQAPSQMFLKWPTVTKDVAIAYFTDAHTDLEVTEENIPPVDENESAEIKGGVSILSNQARGGFYALCESRMQISPFPEPTDGLTYQDQGSLVHAVMDYFWDEVKTSVQLKKLDKGDINTILKRCIDKAFASDEAPFLIRLPIYEKLERQRINSLCHQWLDYEKQRKDEFEVIATEQKLQAIVGELTIEIRVDRIDKVLTEEGPKFLIVDYKTGASASAEGWNPELLTEPQLPIYASSVDLSDLGISRPDGIAIFKLVDGACRAHIWSNFTANLHPAKNDKPISNWPQLLENWQIKLTEHAEQFMAGDGNISMTEMNKHEFTHGHLFELLSTEHVSI